MLVSRWYIIYRIPELTFNFPYAVFGDLLRGKGPHSRDGLIRNLDTCSLILVSLVTEEEEDLGTPCKGIA